LQPDSLIPDPSNPQAWNRYSYVTNRPANFNDPAGHKPCGEGEKWECSTGKKQDPNKDPHPNWFNERKHRGEGGNNNDEEIHHGLHDIINSSEPSTQQSDLCATFGCWENTPPPSYCGGGPNLPSNVFDCIATATQDLATAIDIPFAGTELGLIAIGCFGGGPEACAAGAAAGVEAGIVFFNVTGGNLAEMVLSTTSGGFSFLADASANGISHIGESTVTAVAGVVAGSLSPDPILDLIIDGYGSGYNHDVFNGVFSFFNSDPVIR
jgi:hypothetical protein